jgi:MoaA/NifB/PqqE/SkfB family radical SAM enzyme
LYRGSLSSCNYACGYCPFAKTHNSRAELEQDATELERFVTWIGQQQRTLGILFTPWGEALIHAHYRETMVTLSHLPQVYRVAAQTNLSGRLHWVRRAKLGTIALWATFHPGEIDRQRFLSRCRDLDEIGARYSVGVVGLREHFDEIEALRAELPPEIYLWINAFKRQPDYYRPNELARLRSIDPYFDINRDYHVSADRPCHAGHTAFTVDGLGTARRCHFIPEVIGNIYEPDFERCLQVRDCTRACCGSVGDDSSPRGYALSESEHRARPAGGKKKLP